MKDPAALIYMDKWISATNGMKAEFRAWYMDLLIYQYDKGAIPNDPDEIAGICRVRPSEYDLFKQMLKQVLEQKFSKNEDGNWINKTASEVISKRKNYKDKRIKSGTIGGIVKKAKQISGFKNSFLERLKSELYEKDISELEDYKNENLLKHLLTLYINEDEDVNINKDKKGGVGEKDDVSKIPTEKEFIAYAFTIIPDLDTAEVKAKYISWKDNDWKTGGKNPRKIKNWKNTLANTVPHMKRIKQNSSMNQAVAAKMSKYD